MSISWNSLAGRAPGHGALVPLEDEAQFLDRQGHVQARVSVDSVKEFAC
jgi:hypothetical protein